MDTVSLGRTGLQVSPLCLGTMNFGPRTAEEDAHAILDAARAAGINFVDTANVYGRPVGVGVTESIVGRWLATGGGRREDTVLATKVYGKMGDGPNERRLSAFHVRQACEDSLRRLQTDHIDLYQMHHVHRETPWEEIWQAFELLVQQGKVLYVGSSNFAGWHIARGLRDGAREALPRAGLRAGPVPPARADGRARGAARVPRLRARVPALEPARGRAARGAGARWTAARPTAS